VSAVRDWVAGVLAGAYKPEPGEEPWEWAERTLKVPATENEEWKDRYWSSSETPYVRHLLAWAKRPGKGEYHIKKSSQVGFTMALLILVCWMIVHRSGQIAYAIDSLKEAINISKTRLQQWIKKNDLLESMGEDEDDLNNLTYYLSGCTVYMMGAHSAGAWANKSLVLCILDELDKHKLIDGEGSTVGLARERLKRPKNAKLVTLSTPGGEGDEDNEDLTDQDSQITIEHARGSCDVLDLPCPHCEIMHPLEWENFRYDTAEFRLLDKSLDLEKVEAEAHFVCPSCGGKIYEHHKREMLQGVVHRSTNPKAAPNVVSLYIWDAYSLFVSFGQLALERIAAEGNVVEMARFMRGRRAMNYLMKGGGVADDELLELRKPYKRGTAPACDFLFYAMAVDIQENGEEFKCTKGFYDVHGDFWVVDWDRLVSYDEVVEFADQPLEVNGEEVRVQCGFVDEGNGKDTTLAREFCILDESGRFFPVKGRGASQIDHKWTESNHKTQYGEGVTYHLNDPQHKWELLHRLRRKHYSKEKQKRIGRIYLPSDVDEDEGFLKELTNEMPVWVKNRYGRGKWDWKKRGPNDFWDTLKYIIGKWDIVSPQLFEVILADPERRAVLEAQLAARREQDAEEQETEEAA
jgi:phage terminase large subunit GpA-like protein